MVITFQTQEPDVQDANRDAAVPPNFVPLGTATNAVVMRLSSKLPRLKVTRLTPREEDQSQPL